MGSALEVVACRSKVDVELQAWHCPEIVAAEIDDVVNKLMGVDELIQEVQRPAPNAREVEKVVDEPNFQPDVALHHLEDVGGVVGGVWCRRAWR